MSVPIQVDAYAGYRANERPRRFTFEGERFEIESVEDRWYEPDALYFKVRTADGKRYILRWSEHGDAWTLRVPVDG